MADKWSKALLVIAGDRPGIVVLTIGLEDSLPKLPGTVIPSKLCSPYRLPLLRFLNRYPDERQVMGVEWPG